MVAIVEAMKMESSLTAPSRGRVKKVFVGENMHVDQHSPLLALEPIEQAPHPPTSARLSFESLTASQDAAPDPCRENLRRIEWLVLGYDIGAAQVARTVADLHGQCADLLACDPALIPGEHRLLGMFADLRALSRPDRADPEPESELAQSPKEHLHAWLRSLDAEAEALPRWFIAALRRALGHYGITSLERTPALEEACYRLFLSGQRADIARTAIVAILDRRLEDAESLVGHVGEEFREVLDRLADDARRTRPGHRRSGPRDPLPLLRPAGHRRGDRARVRGDGAALRGCWPPSPGAPTRRPRSRRSSPAHGRWPR